MSTNICIDLERIQKVIYPFCIYIGTLEINCAPVQELTEVEEVGQQYNHPPDGEVELAKDDGLEEVSENLL